MAKISWDAVGEHLYETGVDHGVLYLQDSDGKYSKGVAWNGLTGVTETPGGAETTDLYADNIKYLGILSAETFGGTIEAYTYPDEFAECDGSAEIITGVKVGQQGRKPFGFSYRTQVGNDVAGQDYGYKIHLIYGALASPSEKAYQTINDSPEAITFSWEISTTPVSIDNVFDEDGNLFKPTSCVTIDSTKVGAAGMNRLMNVLYGSSTEEPRLPLPDELPNIIAESVG